MVMSANRSKFCTGNQNKHEYVPMYCSIYFRIKMKAEKKVVMVYFKTSCIWLGICIPFRMVIRDYVKKHDNTEGQIDADLTRVGVTKPISPIPLYSSNFSAS